MQQNEIFGKIDNFIAQIDAHRQEPAFSRESEQRRARAVVPFVDNDMVLRTLSTIIAYSQQAKSQLVRPLLESGQFDEAFSNFSVDVLRNANPCELLDKHWASIKAIKIKTKVFQIVMAARALHTIGPFASVLNDAGIPQRLASMEDVEAFWVGLHKLQKKLKPYDIPFLSSTTSLLHFLLHIGYDCIKPDLIVMRVAYNLGIVKDASSKTNPDLRKVTKLLQEYSVSRGIRPALVDMYFLIQEGQSDAKQFVSSSFKPGCY